MVSQVCASLDSSSWLFLSFMRGRIASRSPGIGGVTGAIQDSLRRQLPDELHRPLDPVLQLFVALDAFRLDQHPPLHRPARDVELLNVRIQ
jgi:hypothetical protein